MIEPRRHLALLGGILLGMVALMTWQVRTGTRLHRVQGGVFAALAPVEEGSSDAARGVRGFWGRYVALRGAQEENDLLRRQLGDAQMRIDQVSEIARENERLRGLLDLRERQGWAAVAARVVAVHQTEHAGILILDSGSTQGVRRDQPVVTEAGLVGRVVEVSPGSAKVQLLTDPSAAVAVVFEESRDRATGIALPGAPHRLRVRYLSARAQVREGEVARTSGLEGIYPPGIAVGVVTKIEERPDLTREAELQPVVSPARLEEVLVLRTDPGAPGATPFLAGR